jgi:hypothetical protein
MKILISRSVSDIIAIGFESKMRLDIQEKLTYKSELLAAMTKCTEKFLKVGHKIYFRTYSLLWVMLQNPTELTIMKTIPRKKQ